MIGTAPTAAHTMVSRDDHVPEERTRNEVDRRANPDWDRRIQQVWPLTKFCWGLPILGYFDMWIVGLKVNWKIDEQEKKYRQATDEERRELHEINKSRSPLLFCTDWERAVPCGCDLRGRPDVCSPHGNRGKPIEPDTIMGTIVDAIFYYRQFLEGNRDPNVVKRMMDDMREKQQKAMRAADEETEQMANSYFSRAMGHPVIGNTKKYDTGHQRIWMPGD
tara:strand:- start:3715 stop:4374 length:660 start_codon:yes stop_codon:yes gene_type:complete